LKSWTKEEALNTIIDLTSEAERLLRESKAFSTEHTVWVTQCLEVFEEIFGLDSRYYLSFDALYWGIPSGTVLNIWKYGSREAAVKAENRKAFQKQMAIAKGLLLAANNYLSKRELKEVYSVRESGTEAGLILTVLNLAEQKLRKLIRVKPEKEKQVQDAFENLLIGADVTYGREVDSIEYSSKTYKPDFSLPEINLAVEVKLCGQEQREKELPEEINDDILAYKTKYQNLIFIVYDLGFIRDIERFCGSFEQHGNVTVRVVKH